MNKYHLLGGVVVVVGVAFGFLGGEYSTLDWWQLKKAADAEIEELETLRAEIDSLRAVADAIESDSAALERVAREELGMLRDGELLFRFEVVVDSLP